MFSRNILLIFKIDKIFLNYQLAYFRNWCSYQYFIKKDKALRFALTLVLVVVTECIEISFQKTNKFILLKYTFVKYFKSF